MSLVSVSYTANTASASFATCFYLQWHGVTSLKLAHNLSGELWYGVGFGAEVSPVVQKCDGTTNYSNVRMSPLVMSLGVVHGRY